MTAQAEPSPAIGSDPAQKTSISGEPQVAEQALRDELMQVKAELARANADNQKHKSILGRRSEKFEMLQDILVKAGIDPTAENLENVLGERLTTNERQELELSQSRAKVATLTENLAAITTKMEASEKAKALTALTRELNILPIYQTSAETLLAGNLTQDEKGNWVVNDRDKVLNDFRGLHKSWIGSTAVSGSGIGSTEGEAAGFMGDPRTWDLKKKSDYVAKYGDQKFGELVRSAIKAGLPKEG